MNGRGLCRAFLIGLAGGRSGLQQEGEMRNKALYLTGTGVNSGKSAIGLGLMQALKRSMHKVGVFKPIINGSEDGKDPDIDLILQYFSLDMDCMDCFAYTRSEARAIINRGSRNLLIENIIKKFKKVVADNDFTLCIGADFIGKDPIDEFELNAEIAANLGCPAILVTNGEGEDYSDILDGLRLILAALAPYGLDVLATIITRTVIAGSSLDELRKVFASNNQPALIYALPNDPDLGRPTINDIVRAVDAELISGRENADTPVDDYIVGAMQVDDFLACLGKGQVVITPGDRADLILAAMASRLSSAMPPISGLLLTGGVAPSASLMRLVKGLTGSTLPLAITKLQTYRAITSLQGLQGLIQPGDTRKIKAALALYEQHINSDEILTRLLEERLDNRMTPMMFEFDLIERASSDKQRIVLAEGEDERILRATDILLRREVADIILLGNVESIRSKASALNLDIGGARIIDPIHADNFDKYARQYYDYRKAKGITPEHARDIMADSTYYGTMMVKLDDADGMVSGAVNTTAHTIRPAFEFIKTKPGFSIVSSVFLMCLKDRVLVFGDCAVNPNPTPQQLAEIAITSAHTAKVFGIVPRVAMLSYSTGNSGKGPDVDLVIEATKIAREMAPELALEGPLQYDAAIDPIVAHTKLPVSQVAGRATVFIFPDLNTGNNTYKAVQRAADAIAIGPVLQGLNKPVNDLSRGCTVADIVNTVAITAVQAASEKNPRTDF